MSSELKLIVRLAGQDLDGSKKAYYALKRIKGVGINMAIAACRLAGLDPDRPLGSYNDEELKRLENIILNLKSYGAPEWFMNRRKDPFTGEHYHLISSDLLLKVREDIEFMKKIKSWKGIRHALGLKVRGQVTRTTGRTGVTVGVTRRKK